MRRAIVAVLMAAVVVVGVAPATPAAEHSRSASTAQVHHPAAGSAAVGAAPASPPSTFFGVHYGPIGVDAGYPDSPALGSVRLWDTGTTWRELQTTPGTWRWDVLDRAVDKAEAHGDSVLYVFGWAPGWASQPIHVPGGRTLVRRGSPPRTDAQWVAYVTKVVQRYKGRIGAYEVWNEANLFGFYAGSVARMVRLAELTYRTVKRVDPHAVVTSPSVTVRGGAGARWMRAYALAGGLRWADVLNVHLYPHPDAGPEEGVVLLNGFRHRLRKVPGGHKTVWNTEMNYGLPRHEYTRRIPLTADQQVAFVLRTFLLEWSAGVRRVYWYDWSAASFLGVHMTIDDGTPTAAAPGRALATVKDWMRGRLSRCTTDRHTTYSCAIDYGGRSRGVVRWNPRHPATVTAPARTTVAIDQYGVVHPARAGQRMRVGDQPVLFRYSVGR